MFEAAVHKFVKSVGEESLLPVPSLDEAVDFFKMMFIHKVHDVFSCIIQQ